MATRTRAVALERAISAAENAVQAVACLRELLTPAEHDACLADGRDDLAAPRGALKTLLPAADKLLAEMRAADS
jgi:hypothetical protein